MCPGGRFWYDVLMRVDTALLLVPKQIPATAVPMMSDLICYCFIVSVACIWYIDFLPPTLFGVPCRCNVFLMFSDRFQPLTNGDLRTFGCFGC